MLKKILREFFSSFGNVFIGTEVRKENCKKEECEEAKSETSAIINELTETNQVPDQKVELVVGYAGVPQQPPGASEPEGESAPVRMDAHGAEDGGVFFGDGSVQETLTIIEGTENLERERELPRQEIWATPFRFAGSRSLRTESAGDCLFQSFASVVGDDYFRLRRQELLEYFRQRWNQADTYDMSAFGNERMTVLLRDIPRNANGEPFATWEEFECWYNEERPKHTQVAIPLIIY
ncbi:Lymphotoxin-beta [Frankliniella fusca]|uniref:Lymphotoxin-beta n=1 Tax=Frankliniella fusca TaxID=407009 RepID=A0AAE1HBT0_9NEOP|nr:Lymphotoxin-beta [Frankliniella fusca]KAK3922270.1 Lymphotoxin-beta [Frankliniella fusca]KAK3926600.1 Lymphotoxin-beta [Frankliniella fusca]